MTSTTKRPVLWVVTLHLGKSHHVWLRRQLERLTGFEVAVICWEDVRSPKERKSDPWVVHELGFAINISGRLERWLHLARRAHLGNSLAAIGAERRALDDLLAQQRPDVVLCQFAYSALRVWPVLRKAGIPVVAHYHGRDLSKLLLDRFYRSSLQRALPKFAGHVAVGSQQIRWLKANGARPERIHLIPCGVPTRVFAPQEASKNWTHDGPVRFVCVGRLVPQKGFHIAIQALAELRKTCEQAELEIVGGGEAEQGKLEALAERCGVRAHVRFAGALPTDQVRVALAAADVFLLPAIEVDGEVEGFGVVVAEAAAMGKPVVVSNSGGIPDQVIDGQTGFICPQGDVQAFAGAMQKLARDPGLCARLGAAGRDNVVARFDTDRQVARLEAVLLAAAGRVDGVQ